MRDEFTILILPIRLKLRAYWIRILQDFKRFFNDAKVIGIQSRLFAT